MDKKNNIRTIIIYSSISSVIFILLSIKSIKINRNIPIYGILIMFIINLLVFIGSDLYFDSIYKKIGGISTYALTTYQIPSIAIDLGITVNNLTFKNVSNIKEIYIKENKLKTMIYTNTLPIIILGYIINGIILFIILLSTIFILLLKLKFIYFNKIVELMKKAAKDYKEKRNKDYKVHKRD